MPSTIFWLFPRLPPSSAADKLDKDEHPRWVAYLFELDWDVCLQVGEQLKQ